MIIKAYCFLLFLFNNVEIYTQLIVQCIDGGYPLSQEMIGEQNSLFSQKNNISHTEIQKRKAFSFLIGLDIALVLYLLFHEIAIKNFLFFRIRGVFIWSLSSMFI
ncbi:MAG TPA: hypothetical protein VL201_05810 [Patescibacteria group bacterium]|nr:hypothetical protein [Patescibacteria group bacterium]